MLFVVGCSDEDENNQIVIKYESQIKEQQKEIGELKQEIEDINFIPNVYYRSSLQEADREARKIMRYISEGIYEELKKEYDIEFEVKEDAVDSGVPESNTPFPIEMAGNFMYIANFIKKPDGMEISYFIDNPKNERSQLIHMSFAIDMEFKFIYVGDA
ncbi:hypothetical protein ACFVR1_05060 [Psychrobacillus sp. NPDC058041]|uniref:hypothetical protein n=1 Tax=Psychrobacillus sp. NPDC058041 TaxID=3346310 RepID=UPI0036DCB0B4